MTRREVLIPSAAAAALLAAMVVHAVWSRPGPVTGAQPAGRPARIRPDYADVVIPPNIAPLNFTVLEPGRRYCVRISGGGGRAIDIHCDSAGIVIPPKPWRRLLQASRGQAIRYDVHVRADAGGWTRFEPIRQTVANEEIDSHLVYRLIRPLYNVYANVAIYQRNLETYDESPVADGRLFGNGCVNCHTFLNHRTRNMLLHVRGSAGAAMLLRADGRLTRVDTRTKYNPSPAAYGCWHPSGKFLTFSVNKLTEFNHSVGETRDVFDHASDLGCYVVDGGAVKSSRHITRPERLETFPTWSPDGKWLYFCSAPKTPIERYRQVKYDLMRVAYDSNSDAWGEGETVLSALQTSLSITEPRICPDGRFVMFCMAEYGNFPVYQPSSDLYLMDLRTSRYRKLAINSDRCESWHCWSSSGRWFVFSSKRRDGVFAKPYFSYFDAEGKAHKPFVLPQEDGDFYESFL
ncbi:MAG: hypothetical protein WBF17_10675, partial [Phycisphaerae bacterium]